MYGWLARGKYAATISVYFIEDIRLTHRKMELTIGVAVGSSIQIAAGMIPLLVIIAWPLQKNLTLFFVSPACLEGTPPSVRGADK